MGDKEQRKEPPSETVTSVSRIGWDRAAHPQPAA
jgi:hypothetical protein